MNKPITFALSIAGGVLVIACVLLLYAYSYVNGLRDQNIDFSTRLNAQYLDNQNELSAYISSFYEQLGVANLKSDQLDRILTDAVKGRYDGETTASPDGGKLFSAIVEAYPDLSTNMSLYDRILDYVQSGREKYKNKQSALLDVLRAYDKWRKSGIVQSWIIKNIIGAPTDDLEARIGRQISRGQDALDQMYVIILDTKSYQAYQSGQLDPLSLQPSTGK